MKDEQNWRPSKFVFSSGHWTCSPTPSQVGRGSRLNVSLLAKAFEEGIPLHCSGRLLDLGCGQVPLYGMYRPYVREIHCVDWDSSSHPLRHIDQCCDLNQVLPLADNCFDTIILSDVLEHIFEPAQLWNEMSRVLKPGGKLLVSVPFLYWIHEAPHDYFRYTEFALRRAVQENSMRVVSLVALGGAIDVVADVIGKASSGLPLRGLGIGILSQRIALWFGKTGRGRRVRRDSAGLLPLGYFLVAERLPAPAACLGEK